MSTKSREQRLKQQDKRQKKKVARQDLIKTSAETTAINEKLELQVASLKHQMARSSDLEHKCSQLERECSALQVEADKSKARTGEMEAIMRQSKKKIEDLSAKSIRDDQLIKELEAESVFKLRRRLKTRSDELRNARTVISRLKHQMKERGWADDEPEPVPGNSAEAE